MNSLKLREEMADWSSEMAWTNQSRCP